MANPDLAVGALQKSGMVTRADKRAREARNTERKRLAAYRLAEFRDGMRCRACGRKVVKTLSVVPNRCEHHHIAGRQVKDSEETRNIVILCLQHHEERHIKRTLHISGNADSTLTFTRGSEVWHG